MLTIRSPIVVLGLLLVSLLAGVDAAPQNGRTGRNRNGRTRGGAATQLTAQQQAAQVDQGISEATDGSTILDSTATVNGLDLRFKVSAPADQFTVDSGVNGGAQQAGDQGALGLNVLLHGDGGQSFFDFPNQAVQGGLAGVVILAPDPNLFWGGGSGLDRTDGVAHAAAVNDFVQNVLPQVLAFNSSNVFFTGVSGGALLLSGFFIPAHLSNFLGNGVLLNCGALAPQVDFVNGDAIAASSRLHFQSTQQELALLQPAIPEAILAYEQLALQAGLNAQEINALQTVDNTPNGGHCEFDELGFVSGIQLIADNFANIMQGGNGNVNGIGNVLNGVVGNENLQFLAATKLRRGMVG